MIRTNPTIKVLEFVLAVQVVQAYPRDIRSLGYESCSKYEKKYGKVCALFLIKVAIITHGSLTRMF